MLVLNPYSHGWPTYRAHFEFFFAKYTEGSDRCNCCGVSLLWIVHLKSSQEQNNKRRLQVGLGVTELLNDHSINMFSDELWHDLCLFSFMIL